MKIVLIGTGNVGTILGRKMVQAGHDVLQVYGRRAPEAAELAELIGADPVTDFAKLYSEADLYIMAVSDGSIRQVASGLHFTDQPLVHTAGAVSREVLKEASSRYGVLYPLQSLRKEITEIPAEIPFLVDGNKGEMIALVSEFAQSLSGRVQVAGDEERLKLHIGAVMVSNFTNHLYALAENYCRKENLDFGQLLPLIAETAMRIKEISPKSAQTGPAVRHDGATIQKHLELLKDHPHLRDIYLLLTESIQQTL